MERRSLNRRGFFEFLTPAENNAHIYSAVMYEQSRQLPKKAVHGHVLVTNLKMGTLSEESIHVRPPQKKSTNFVENEITSVMIYHRGASLSEQHTDLLICHCA